MDQMLIVFQETARQGGMSWSVFLANALGANPIAGPGYLMCPRCLLREDFGLSRPTRFRRRDSIAEYENWLSPIYVCRNCTHVFSPLAGPSLLAALDNNRKT